MRQTALNQKAPDISLKSPSGTAVALSHFIGKKHIVLFFYPKDGTPICTTEVCSFRDNYRQFQELDAELIGISSDSPASHRNFSGRHELPFVLLSDRSGEARKAFGVPNSFGILPGRVTYVIDKQGIVRHIVNSQLQPQKHVDEALKVLRELNELDHGMS